MLSRRLLLLLAGVLAGGLVIAGLLIAGPWNRSDDGDPADVDAVRDAVVELVSADQSMVAMPAAVSERRSTLATRLDEIRRRVLAVWAPDRADAETRQKTALLREAVLDATYLAYREAVFVVDDWHRVVVDGDRATAELVGHTDFLDHGGRWTSGARADHVLTLARQDDGSWRLVDDDDDIVAGEH